ncbi:serine hydrolase domain-containing protein [Hyalangium sp.]|uniref:serine hydrolase domain-containing protein n=1 Tax=Hyalangium sp. TaxID=2028555 RepID=UPI002D56AD45|nr:serine hydrolase domain-containing protein [Hyalangium sp.]HYI00460.1 serine hydrolase domain-containing protein [Hyalangium sp.]
MRRWAAVLALALASCTHDTAGTAPSRAAPVSAEAEWLDAETKAQIDALFAEHDRADTPGYAVGIIKDGRLVFAKGYGQANLDDQIPITPRTSFHLASLSKQFTAAAIALLILDGQVSLEDPVSKYLPETARFGPDLRVKHLLYMTSGLPEYMSLPRKSGMPWYSAYYFTREEALAATLSADKLDFAPGTRPGPTPTSTTCC